MVDSDSNMVKPVEGMQNIAGLFLHVFISRKYQKHYKAD